MSDVNFILDFQKKSHYPYLEEVNEGILKQIPPINGPATILDVGAGRGLLGAALVKLGYEVSALESNTLIAEEAKKRVHQVICADLHDVAKVRDFLQGKKFNYIVFSDVLEHVYDPLQILRDYQEFLQDDGKILISLPNVVNWLNRLRFIFGIFNYEMTGVMDRTHIRFFTFHSAKKMVQASAYKIEKVDCTPFLARAFLPTIKRILSNKKDHSKDSIITSPYYKLYCKFLYPLEYWISRLRPTLFAFRIILVASKLAEKKLNEC
ncbi:class I SAM-dependent methyltransferase [Legionella sp. CNM-1927-20]|uniref:class I SAM-dependent methyltransferase n=1 Tax=Legionella sp. CNM-1927-20 TaxID=3422221 RepID=UPI00403B2396